MDGPSKVQSLAIQAKCKTVKPQILVATEPKRDSFRSVDQVLPAAELRMLPIVDALEVGHISFDHLSVSLLMWFGALSCGVERRRYEVRRGHARISTNSGDPEEGYARSKGNVYQFFRSWHRQHQH